MLEALTSMDPSTAPWIAIVNDVWHVRGIPTNMHVKQIVDHSRGGLWEEASLEGAWHAYRSSTSVPEDEAPMEDIPRLACHWRSIYRSEDQLLFARELRRNTYQKWEQEFKDQKVIYTMTDGTRVTLGMLERLIKAEPVKGFHPVTLEVTHPYPTEFIIAGNGDSLQAEIDRFSPASGGTTALEYADYVSPFTEEDINHHLPGKPVGEGECV